jgi:hypothetical protein
MQTPCLETRREANCTGRNGWGGAIIVSGNSGVDWRLSVARVFTGSYHTQDFPQAVRISTDHADVQLPVATVVGFFKNLFRMLPGIRTDLSVPGAGGS